MGQNRTGLVLRNTRQIKKAPALPRLLNFTILILAKAVSNRFTNQSAEADC